MDKYIAKNEVLIIKSKSSSFESYYCEKMMDYEYDVLNLEDVLGTNIKIKNKYSAAIYALISGKLRSKIKNYRLIIAFSGGNLIPMLSFCKPKECRLIDWEWNIYEKSQRIRIAKIRPFCEIWTFDENDAKKNHWKWNNQFYFPVKNIPRKHCSKQTALFVGVDKGRFCELKKLQEVLELNGVCCEFFIVADENTNINLVNEKLFTTPMSYQTVLQKIEACDIIIEIVQSKQVGLTARALEAQFYQKKLITNCEGILQAPFYNENNVFSLQTHSLMELSEFLSKPHLQVNSEILNEYSFSKWIENFRER